MGLAELQNWHHLYVFKDTNDGVTSIALLQCGSRADGGLQGINIRNGILVLEFADADRREGDCCSRGVIRVRYRLQNGRFIEAAERQKDSVSSVSYPSPRSGPNSVGTSVQGRNVNIVYRDERAIERALTSSDVNVEPNLSPDKSNVVYLSELNGNQHEIRSIGTNGSGQRLLFRGDVRWNDVVYSCATIRSPQWSLGGQAVYFVTDFSAMEGALWRLDLESQKLAVIVSEAVLYGVIQTGSYEGFLSANQRTDPPAGQPYPVYPFFLYTPRGENVEQIGEEIEDLDSLLAEWEHR